MYTHVEVEPNDNTPMSANLAFKNLSEPFAVARVRLFEGQPEGRVYAITGWQSAADGSPGPVYAVQVEDSGSGAAFLIYGGDWGVRLRPAASEGDWSTEDAEQFGETHLVLADRDDIEPA
jgi:hypothetical protein